MGDQWLFISHQLTWDDWLQITKYVLYLLRLYSSIINTSATVMAVFWLSYILANTRGSFSFPSAILTVLRHRRPPGEISPPMYNGDSSASHDLPMGRSVQVLRSRSSSPLSHMSPPRQLRRSTSTYSTDSSSSRSDSTDTGRRASIDSDNERNGMALVPDFFSPFSSANCC